MLHEIISRHWQKNNGSCLKKRKIVEVDMAIDLKTGYEAKNGDTNPILTNMEYD